jgi:hypothetical protein
VGPGKSIFDAFSRAVGKINLIAEDLVSFIRYQKKKKKTLNFHHFHPFILIYDPVALLALYILQAITKV